MVLVSGAGTDLPWVKSRYMKDQDVLDTAQSIFHHWDSMHHIISSSQADLTLCFQDPLLQDKDMAFRGLPVYLSPSHMQSGKADRREFLLLLGLCSSQSCFPMLTRHCSSVCVSAAL